MHAQPRLTDHLDQEVAIFFEALRIPTVPVSDVLLPIDSEGLDEFFTNGPKTQKHARLCQHHPNSVWQQSHENIFKDSGWSYPKELSDVPTEFMERFRPAHWQSLTRRQQDIVFFFVVIQKMMVADNQTLCLETKHSIQRCKPKMDGGAKIVIPGSRMVIIRRQHGILEGRLLLPQEAFRLQGWYMSELGAPSLQ